MNKIMLKLALFAVLFATPVALAQQGRGGAPGNAQTLTQTLNGILAQYPDDLEAAQAAAGLLNIQLQFVNVNVQALNNVNVNVQLTDVLNELGILTDSQVVVNVLTFGDQFVVRVLEGAELP